MFIDIELSKRIHSIVTPEGKEFDICKAANIMTSYLSTMFKVSKDKFENKKYFWHTNDFQKIMKDRAYCQRLLLKLLSQLDYQINASLESMVQWTLHREKELTEKRDRRQVKKKPDQEKEECKK